VPIRKESLKKFLASINFLLAIKFGIKGLILKIIF